MVFFFFLLGFCCVKRKKNKKKIKSTCQWRSLRPLFLLKKLDAMKIPETGPAFDLFITHFLKSENLLQRYEMTIMTPVGGN